MHPSASAPSSPGPELERDWHELGHRVRLLRGVPALRGLSWDLLSALAVLLRPATLPAGAELCRQGEPAETFWVIATGRVHRLRADGDGEGQGQRLGPGDACGNAVLREEAVYAATERAETDVALWALDAAQLGALRARNPALAVALKAAPPPQATSSTRERYGIRVEARGLSRRVRGGRQVLHDVTLTVDAGELVAIVGGSGAGKSTLLDALAGVRAADEGTVLYDGWTTTATSTPSGPRSATSRRTTSSAVNCRCGPPCATQPGSGCPRGPPRRRSSARWATRWTRSTSENARTCPWDRCRAGSASARASRSSC